MNESKQQLEAVIEEVKVNTERRQPILNRILDIEQKIRYLETNKLSLQSNPNYDRIYTELSNERARLNKYIGQ